MVKPVPVTIVYREAKKFLRYHFQMPMTDWMLASSFGKYLTVGTEEHMLAKTNTLEVSIGVKLAANGKLDFTMIGHQKFEPGDNFNTMERSAPAEVAVDSLEEVVGNGPICIGKHNDSPIGNFDSAQVKLGLKSEYEHTDDPDKALAIVKDHLTEDPQYYTKLQKIEQGEAFRKWQPRKKFIEIAQAADQWKDYLKKSGRKTGEEDPLRQGDDIEFIDPEDKEQKVQSGKVSRIGSDGVEVTSMNKKLKVPGTLTGKLK